VRPLVLASKSPSRAAILRAAGLAFETMSADVDEEAQKQALLESGASPRELAGRLAEAKAEQASRARPDALVIGADTTLDLDGRLYDKATSVADAREKLLALKGRRHRLHSAVAAASAGAVVWSALESPGLLMRDFSDAFLECYLAMGGEAILGSVGCYHFEGVGAQLFEAVEGDYFAILGLPLLPLLAFLRADGALMT
jgi:septum formation protein